MPAVKVICENCPNPADVHTPDGADLCDECAKESVVICVGCGEKMVYTVTIYIGQDRKPRCQLCDMKQETT